MTAHLEGLGMSRLLFAVLSGLLVFRAHALSAAPLFLDGAPPEHQGQPRHTVELPSFADLVEPISHAVVNISVEAAEDSDKDTADSPLFKRETGRPLRSLGSGFIVSEDGYIVTNGHVIEKSEK